MKWMSMIRYVFVGDIGKIRFICDANQHMSVFSLDAGRIQNFPIQEMSELQSGRLF